MTSSSTPLKDVVEGDEGGVGGSLPPGHLRRGVIIPWVNLSVTGNGGTGHRGANAGLHPSASSGHPRTTSGVKPVARMHGDRRVEPALRVDLEYRFPRFRPLEGFVRRPPECLAPSVRGRHPKPFTGADTARFHRSLRLM